jgi:NAD(P)-dependent dehydrogenase (short-subunit alcohol dehydrogenase family)
MDNQTTSTDQPVALVTGANQGVGNEIAKALVANGYTVYVGSRKTEKRRLQSLVEMQKPSNWMLPTNKLSMPR